MKNIQMSLLVGRITKRNLACCFYSFLEVFEWGFLQKFSTSTERKDRLKPGKLLNLIGHIGNKARQFSISLL